MLSVQPVGMSFKGYDKSGDVEDRLVAIYNQQSEKKGAGVGSRVVPALILSTVSALTAKKVYKVVTDNAVAKMAAEKGKKITASIAEKLPERFKKLPEIKNAKVKAVVDFVADKVKAFSNFGGEKNLGRNTATVAGAVFGFKKGYMDKDGNGVSDIKEAFSKTENAIGLVGEVASVLG
jgi:hypothetical protein